jgi:hypothetical protein
MAVLIARTAALWPTSRLSTTASLFIAASRDRFDYSREIRSILIPRE